MDKNRAALLAGVGALLGLGLASASTLDAREVGVVTRFGAPVRALTEPGLYLHAPWPFETLVRFDARLRVLETPATEFLTADKKNLVVEAFAIWRVTDPQRFLEAVGQVEAAEAQLVDLVRSRIGAAMGKMDLTAVLTVESGAGGLLPDTLVEEVSATALSRFGVRVLDVRLRQVSLPIQNEQSIYERMKAERQRIANQYRSEGEEQATAIKAAADREAAELLATADREAAIILAGAEKEAAARYAEAYRANPPLYTLLADMDAYRAVLDEDTTVVLDGQSGFFAPLSGRGASLP